jgi:hypothetical protein
MQRGILLVATALVGCAIGFNGQPIGAGGAGDGHEAGGELAECNEVRETVEEAQKSISQRETPATTDRQRALVMACPTLKKEITNRIGQKEEVWLRQKVSLPRATDIHKEFDARHPHMIMAAALVLGADIQGNSTSCGLKSDESCEREANVGLAATYAGMVDATQLGSELDAARISGEARAELSKRLAARTQELNEQLAAMPAGKRAVLYDIPSKLYRALRDDAAKYRDLYARLDDAARADANARTAGSDTAPLVAKLVALRSEFLAACGGTEECSYHPLYIETTFELATLYVASKSGELAHAESDLLTRRDSRKNQFQQAMYLAQSHAAEAATVAYAHKKNAAGLDPKLAAVVGGAEPINFQGVKFFEAPTAYPQLASVLEKGSSRARAFVKSVSKSGARLRIEFTTQFTVDEVSYNCVKTNRVLRIRDDGTLEYEERCQTRKERRADKTDPIVVDAAEGAQVKRGDLVVAWVAANAADAVIVEVRAGKDGSDVVQLRRDRVKPEATVKPAPTPGDGARAAR